ncbi:MAG TPA: hypothetical protein DC049_11350 [Spirochaetia bacterium]|nr:hypothetical protein [Spirochaetia bacterium]
MSFKNFILSVHLEPVFLIFFFLPGISFLYSQTATVRGYSLFTPGEKNIVALQQAKTAAEKDALRMFAVTSDAFIVYDGDKTILQNQGQQISLENKVYKQTGMLMECSGQFNIPAQTKISDTCRFNIVYKNSLNLKKTPDVKAYLAFITADILSQFRNHLLKEKKLKNNQLNFKFLYIKKKLGAKTVPVEIQYILKN